MGFLDAVKSVFSQYATFTGRARRSEYWYFVLFNYIVSLGLVLTGVQMLSYIWSLATFIPGLAVAVRRMHDIGKSGWFLLIAFIPIVGAIWLIVLCCKDSQPDNQYGPNPKAVTE